MHDRYGNNNAHSLFNINYAPATNSAWCLLISPHLICTIFTLDGNYY